MSQRGSSQQSRPEGSAVAAEASPGDLAPAVAGAPPIKQTERPHPLTPFIRGWLVLVAIVVGLGRELVPDGARDSPFTVSDLRWVLPLILVVLLGAGLVGFVSWYFTRFVIDDDELRIETGALFKNSKRIAFERLQSIDLIQPFAARIFGLAELRLEVGAGDSTVKLRYLSRTNASQLRDYLLARAHGERTSRSVTDLGPASSLLTDLAATDRPLVTVSPQRLVAGFVLSSEWLFTVATAAVALAVSAGFGVITYALPGLLPLVIGGISMIGRRVVSMFNFTLAQSSRGLRVTRGLTNLTSQSVPVDRIQGVKISQPLLWRWVDWYRVDVDILGYGASAGENNESDATSVLLPVASTDQVRLALAEVLPDVDLDTIALQRSPGRARWLHWFTAHTLRYGWNESVLLTEHGLLTRVRNVVPHAKTQSVRIRQGPLQRGLRLADVHVDTPRGPVNAVARELAEVTARELAMSQLDRARAARRRARDQQSARPAPLPIPAERAVGGEPPGPDEADQAVLARFGIDGRALLGRGGECTVFAIDDAHVLRLYRPSHESPARVIPQLRALYNFWAQADVGFETPRIVDSGQLSGRHYTVDRRMSGRVFSEWLAQAPQEERRDALRSYLRIASSLSRLPAPVLGFARLVGPDAPQQFASLAELLSAQLQRVIGASRDRLTADVPEISRVWANWHANIARRRCQPALVHGDLCPSNVFCSRAPDGTAVVTGVLDFSPHTLAADPLMDITGAICFLELESYAGASDDAAWLADYAAAELGADILPWVQAYRQFYGFYFSSAHAVDERLYAWCVNQLRTSPAG
ncbi:MAG TPA: PH domain-containing protein [Propionibacteriaceae bacterium]|nr:PH domain-containing protein [Propionibacteriaceae bacterium]